MLGFLLTGLALGLPAAAQPGPFQAYLLGQTMRNGWQRTLPAALAPLFSDAPIVALVLLLLTQLPPLALLLLKGAGGLFLLYLAWGAFRSWRAFRATPVNDSAAGRQSLREATLMNLLNPNPYAFWSTVGGPLLLEAWRLSVGHALSYLIGFYGALIGGMALLIVLFGALQQLGPRVERALLALSVVLLAGIGLWQLAQVIEALRLL
ncbi:MAG: LysE family transporter [Anaerolineales bacterium]|nr:LysE family transporter [Anaerolineales bacterium]MCB9127684.1 LysE family transporter [Ardenticatenales bacterium]